MKSIRVNSMVENGVVKEDGAYGASSNLKLHLHPPPSRGFYIVDLQYNNLYLHKDSQVKEGVGAFNETPAFWETREKAEQFFNEWKKNQTK